MSLQSAKLSYLENLTRTASPVGLVVILYDVAIRSLQNAAEALARGDIELRTAETGHALRVLEQLQGTLNREQGGEVGRALDEFYSMLRTKIVEAGAEQSEETLNSAVAGLYSLREAWQEVERQTRAAEADMLTGADDEPQARANGTGWRA